MNRRVCMWIAVTSLVGLGLISAATSLAYFSVSDGGWTFSLANSEPPPTLAMRLLEASPYVEVVLRPLAALSSAGYILLLDRDVRRGSTSRGFEVQAPRSADGT